MAFFVDKELIAMENIEIVQSKPVMEMLAVSMEYCRFISEIQQYELPEAFDFLQKILPALYLKGSLFPSLEAADDSANERFVTEEEYETMRVRIAARLGERDYFSTVDLANDDINAVPIALSELLADIYTDLKDFILLYAKESLAAKENAVANCRYYFQTGWGARVTQALPYIHFVLSSPEKDEE